MHSLARACAGLLSPQQQEEWNHFHAATWLSKAVRAAVRFAPWTLKGLARISETRIGGRVLYNTVLKGLVSKSLMPSLPLQIFAFACAPSTT